MTEHEDMIGKKFGKLSVVGLCGRDSGGSILWDCVCVCGAKSKRTSANLKGGQHNYCVACKSENTRVYVAKEGDKFSRWTVIQANYPTKKKGQHCLCACDCGNTKVIRSTSLFHGETRSCGCLKKEIQANRKRTHGMERTPIYQRWCAMKSRCNNPNSPNYKNYGGRGILLCNEWHDFENFLSWAMSNGFDESLTIERINVNGNYEPNNVTWATNKEQANNRRDNVLIESNGETKTMAQWEEKLEIRKGRMWAWKDRKRNIERLARSQNGHIYSVFAKYKGEEYGAAELAQMLSIPLSNIYRWIKQGQEIDKKVSDWVGRNKHAL